MNWFWLALTNAAGCVTVQMGIAWGITQLPGRLFRPEAGLYRKRSLENDGRIYERFFLIRKWKPLLPDGAAWFRGGFPKQSLQDRSPEYFLRFEHPVHIGAAL